MVLDFIICAESRSICLLVALFYDVTELMKRSVSIFVNVNKIR